jgi:hypothetical protein
MKQRMLGPFDLVVSRLGLGTSTWGATTDKDEAGQHMSSLLVFPASVLALASGAEVRTA